MPGPVSWLSEFDPLLSPKKEIGQTIDLAALFGPTQGEQDSFELFEPNYDLSMSSESVASTDDSSRGGGEKLTSILEEFDPFACPKERTQASRDVYLQEFDPFSCSVDSKSVEAGAEFFDWCRQRQNNVDLIETAKETKTDDDQMKSSVESDLGSVQHNASSEEIVSSDDFEVIDMSDDSAKLENDAFLDDYEVIQPSGTQEEEEDNDTDCEPHSNNYLDEIIQPQFIENASPEIVESTDQLIERNDILTLDRAFCALDDDSRFHASADQKEKMKRARELLVRIRERILETEIDADQMTALEGSRQSVLVEEAGSSHHEASQSSQQSEEEAPVIQANSEIVQLENNTGMAPESSEIEPAFDDIIESSDLATFERAFRAFNQDSRLLVSAEQREKMKRAYDLLLRINNRRFAAFE